MREQWIDVTVNVTIRQNLGSFGISYDRQGEFRFCARSREEAVGIAGHFVKGATRPISDVRMAQIVGYVPVPWEVVEMARQGKSGTELKSLGDVDSERTELEYA